MNVNVKFSVSTTDDEIKHGDEWYEKTRAVCIPSIPSPYFSSTFRAFPPRRAFRRHHRLFAAAFDRAWHGITVTVFSKSGRCVESSCRGGIIYAKAKG